MCLVIHEESRGTCEIHPPPPPLPAILLWKEPPFARRRSSEASQLAGRTQDHIFDEWEPCSYRAGRDYEKKKKKRYHTDRQSGSVYSNKVEALRFTES